MIGGLKELGMLHDGKALEGGAYLENGQEGRGYGKRHEELIGSEFNSGESGMDRDNYDMEW